MKKKATTPNQRRHPRVPLPLLVQVRSESIASFRALHAKNISVGGMFIEHPPSSPALLVGHEFYFQFTVKDGGALIEGMARVVHANEAGVGVEFTSVLEPSRSIIAHLVQARLEQGT